MRRLMTSFIILLGLVVSASAQNTTCSNRPFGDDSNACANTRFVQSAVTAAATPPGGTNGQIQYNNSGAFGGFTMGGDCTMSIPNITCTKVNGVVYGSSPAVDTVAVVTATNQTTYTALPNCGTGFTLQYVTSTHQFQCSAAGSGTVSFAGNGLILSGGGSTLGINAPVSAANGGTGVVSPTANTIPINQGSSPQTNTGVGSTGQALMGNTGGAPTFKSGSWTLLNTISASGASFVDDTTSFTTNYHEYEIVFQNLVISSSANLTPYLQVWSGGSVQTTSYFGQFLGGSSTTGTAVAITTGIQINYTSTGLNGGGGISGFIRVLDPAIVSVPKVWFGQSALIGTTGAPISIFGGGWNSVNALQGFRIGVTDGTFSTGTIKVYGRN